MSNSLRIALLTYATKPRGSVIHTLELAEALQQLGHHVCVYALDKDGSGFHRPVNCAVKLVPAQPADGGTDALIQQRIREFVDFLSGDLIHNDHYGQCYDIYHAQDCISANALSELRQRGLISRFCRTVHHIDDFTSPYLQACQERSIREPDLCLCVSDVWQTTLKDRYGREAVKVLNGVDRARFTAVSTEAEQDLKQQLGLTGYPIYLTVGGIEPRKNSIALLKAFTTVLTEYPYAQLVIAGGATLFDYQDYRDRFFDLVHQHAIAIGTSLILPGVIPDLLLPILYRTADAFVFPSLKEGWGLVLLEAIAAGLPVLTANQPPFTEFLSPQQALLIDPQSPAAIAQAMLTLVQPAVYQSLIQANQSLCDRYTWENSAKMHLEHYKTIGTLS